MMMKMTLNMMTKMKKTIDDDEDVDDDWGVNRVSLSV